MANIGALSTPHTLPHGRASSGLQPSDVPRLIVKELSEIERYAHDRPLRIFQQWLDVQLAHYHAAPLAVAYASKHHTLPIEAQRWIDSQRPETATALSEIKSYYGRHADKVFEHFHKAQNILWEIAEAQVIGDWLGGVYQHWELANKGSQQYFTPWNIAYMMAKMTLEAAEIGEEYTADNPLKILEPCCGSGVMLLAAADVLGPEVHNQQRVRYYAIDIDITCVKMCRIQLMLYGLNGYDRLARRAACGYIDVDVPESVANYEQAFTEVIDYVKHANALTMPFLDQHAAQHTAEPVTNGKEQKQQKGRRVPPPTPSQAATKPAKTKQQQSAGNLSQVSMFDE